MVEFAWFLLFVLALFAAGILQIVMHEASHAVVVLLHGGARIVEFRPYPVLRRPFSLQGFIRVEYYKDPGNTWNALMYAAPLFASAMAVAVYYVVGGWAHFFCIWPIIDILWWWLGYFIGTHRNDGRKFRYFWGMR